MASWIHYEYYCKMSGPLWPRVFTMDNIIKYISSIGWEGFEPKLWDSAVF